MRFWKPLVLLGLVIIVIGIGIAQISSRSAKELKNSNVSLTEASPTWVLDLGTLEKDTRIKINFIVSGAGGIENPSEPYDPHRIIFMVMEEKTSTIVPLDTGPYIHKKGDLYVNTTGTKTGPYEWVMPRTTEYVIKVSKFEKIESLTISFFNVVVLRPTEYPYSTPGYVLSGVGAVVIVIGIIMRRR